MKHDIFALNVYVEHLINPEIFPGMNVSGLTRFDCIRKKSMCKTTNEDIVIVLHCLKFFIIYICLKKIYCILFEV